MDGIFNLDKPPGITSHEAVARVRRLLAAHSAHRTSVHRTSVHRTKVGHAGTLDPDARGVLPVCVGLATRLFPFLLECEKTYRATMRFGVVTDTQDASGEVLEVRPLRGLDREAAEALLAGFVGELEQVPPMFSALRRGGARLHELAREGRVVEREPRRVSIRRIKLLALEGEFLTFEVTCSRGTYIRTLCHDLGERQGAGGHLVGLVRMQLGPFRLEDAHTLEGFNALAREGRLGEALVGLEAALGHLPRAVATRQGVERFAQGAPVRSADLASLGALLRVGDAGGGRVGVARSLFALEDAPEGPPPPPSRPALQPVRLLRR
ncbi:MAG: tRNA pseudouridine(55) synthase TruB [Nitrospinota bacterium]